MSYIYFIINEVTKQRYVGKTTDFSRRKQEHLLKLKTNAHINKKLQNSFNKYGEDSFSFESIQFDNISNFELSQKEIFYIKNYDSFNNGFNLTLGGDGGNTRSKLNFEEFCLAYFGNKKYEGMTNKTGKFLKIDSSCISAIAREKSYDLFREKANQLSNKEKEQYLMKFEEIFDIANKKPTTMTRIDDEKMLKIFCAVSTYGRGIEATILKKFNLGKGLVCHSFKDGHREKVKTLYDALSKEEIQKIGKETFEEWDLQKYSQIKIKEEYKNLFFHYKLRT